jgi:hypothetical protein
MEGQEGVAVYLEDASTSLLWWMRGKWDVRLTNRNAAHIVQHAYCVRLSCLRFILWLLIQVREYSIIWL